MREAVFCVADSGRILDVYFSLWGLLEDGVPRGTSRVVVVRRRGRVYSITVLDRRLRKIAEDCAGRLEALCDILPGGDMSQLALELQEMGDLWFEAWCRQYVMGLELA